jgi:hypothetical protein
MAAKSTGSLESSEFPGVKPKGVIDQSSQCWNNFAPISIPNKFGLFEKYPALSPI